MHDALLQEPDAFVAPCALGHPFVSVVRVPNSEGARLGHSIGTNFRAVVVVHALDEGPPHRGREPLRGAELLDVPGTLECTMFTCYAVGRLRCIDAVVIFNPLLS